MFRRFGPNYMALQYLLDLGSAALALWAAQRLRVLPVGPPIHDAEARVPLLVYGLVALIFGIILPLLDLYDARRIFRASNEAARVVLGTLMSGCALAGALFLTYRGVSRIVFLYFVAGALLLLLGYRGVLRALYRTVRWGTQMPVVLIAGAGPLGEQAAAALDAAGAAIAGFIDDDAASGGRVNGRAVLGGLDEIPAVVERWGVTDIVFALPRHAQERLAGLLVSLWKLPLRVYTIPDFFDLGVARTRVDYLGGLTLVGLREPVIDGFQRVAKRLVDLALGCALFLCALPVMGLIALAIRLDSPGPVVFRQQRVGENGRLFTMYKFRTMVADAERRQDPSSLPTRSGKVIHKRADDPRVTRVGRVLRRLSLDELLQLVNVLRGEMSLVGPRPEMPWVVAQYDPWQYQRLAVPQGMTSWYVVNGRSETPMHLNTQEDLRYVHNYSLFQDLKILWKSVGAVLRGRGAF
ncbi:MAG TPA: sugar transferase [bacterium]|nr:sugar transferase [bacterium]